MENAFINVIGPWKVSAVLSGVDGTLKRVTREEAEQIADFGFSLFDAITELRQDGTVCDLLRIPQDMPREEIDNAVAAGYELAGDFFVAGKHAWKEENGKNFYNTNINGEILGEELSHGLKLRRTQMEILRLTHV